MNKKIKRQKIKVKAFKNFVKEIALTEGKTKCYYLSKHKYKREKKKLKKLYKK